MINIVAKRMWFLTASTIILIVGILSLTFPPHLNLGIDFLSGTGVTVKFVDEVSSSQIENQFTKIGLDSPSIQSMGDKTYFIRTEKLSDFDLENNDSTVSRNDLEKSIEEIDKNAEIIEIESVGTKVAEGTVRNSIVAVSSGRDRHHQHRSESGLYRPRHRVRVAGRGVVDRRLGDYRVRRPHPVLGRRHHPARPLAGLQRSRSRRTQPRCLGCVPWHRSGLAARHDPWRIRGCGEGRRRRELGHPRRTLRWYGTRSRIAEPDHGDHRQRQRWCDLGLAHSRRTSVRAAHPDGGPHHLLHIQHHLHAVTGARHRIRRPACISATQPSYSMTGIRCSQGMRRAIIHFLK